MLDYISTSVLFYRQYIRACMCVGNMHACTCVFVRACANVCTCVCVSECT